MEVNVLSPKNRVSTLKVTAMYMGAIIGAGFASGQEIMQFITMHGPDGIKEVILITLLFSYLGASTLFLSVRLNTDNYFALFNYLLGTKAGKMLDILSMLMLFGGLSIMLSGSGAIFSEHFNLPGNYGIFIVVLINCIILLGGLHGVLWINAVLVPIKITAIIIISLLIIHMENALNAINNTVQYTGGISNNWVWSGILYVSYNMILVVAVLTTLGKNINNREAIIGGLVGGLGLGFTAGVMYLAGFRLYPEIINYKVPMLYMAGIIGHGLKNVMGLLIWIAILTTTVANAHGFAARLAIPGSRNYKIIGMGATIMAIPLASMEFDKLVRTLYPIFGYAGLLLIFFLLLAPPLILIGKQKKN